MVYAVHLAPFNGVGNDVRQVGNGRQYDKYDGDFAHFGFGRHVAVPDRGQCDKHKVQRVAKTAEAVVARVVESAARFFGHEKYGGTGECDE